MAKQQKGITRGCKYSTAHRFHEIRKICEEPSERDAMVNIFMQLSTLRGAVSTVGFERHPDFKPLFDKDAVIDKESSAMWKRFEEIVYRQDLATKYTDHRAARLHHLKEVSKYTIAYVPGRPTTEHEMLTANTLTHFRLVHSSFHSFTFLLYDGFSPPMMSDLDSSILQSQADDDLEIAEPEAKRRKTDEGDIAADALALPEDSSRICFRVLNTGAGRMKHIANVVRSSGAPKLRLSDIAVTLHEELGPPS